MTLCIGRRRRRRQILNAILNRIAQELGGFGLLGDVTGGAGGCEGGQGVEVGFGGAVEGEEFGGED